LKNFEPSKNLNHNGYILCDHDVFVVAFCTITFVTTHGKTYTNALPFNGQN